MVDVSARSIKHNMAQTNQQKVRRVFIITLVLNLVVSFGKIVLGTATGALAITADGFHSLTDGINNVVSIIAMTFSNQPPDDDHPYGHGRFENLATLFIGAMLLFLAWNMTSDLIGRISGDHGLPELDGLAFAVLIGTLAVNIFVTVYQTRAGKRLKSDLLIADASQTRSDVFITISVLFSMWAIQLTGWSWIDTVAAIVVLILILRTAWEILQQTGSVLVDTAPYAPDELIAIIEAVTPAQDIVRVRSRGTVDDSYIDIDLCVPPVMTVAQTATIAETIRAQLHQALEGIREIEIHFTPDCVTENAL
jgi:cation diffusion facilitator family transporter